MKTNTNQTSYNQKNQMNNNSSNNNKTGRSNADKRFYDSYKYEVANELGEKVGEMFPECDVEVHYGGQPIYYYVVSVE